MSSKTNSHSYKVIKRDGTPQDINYTKINNRIAFLCKGELRDKTIIGDNLDLCYDKIVIDVISTIKDGITTQELDEHASRLCINKCNEDNNYGILAARIAISNHHKNTLNSFSKTMEFLYNNTDKAKNHVPLVSEEFINFVMKNSEELDNYIDYIRDYNLSYFGHMTLFDAYYLIGRNNNAILRERTQHLYMRIAIALNMNNMVGIKKTYDILSENGGYVSHATPTMYNAGTIKGQLASCFLTGMSDSMDDERGIPELWKDCAKISKRAGGIGICITNIRGKGSRIRGTNGESDGVIPLCKVLNDISRYVNQGGKRKGSFAVYIEPWHVDIESFIELKKNHGNEDERARDLFLGLWIPDLFMKRLIYAIQNKTAVKWSLMCPDASHIKGDPRLYDVYGEEFENLYLKYENMGLYIKQIEDIRDLWQGIISAQQESGVPYILYKDHINNKNNQSNLGTIRTSNLCAEIVEYSDENEHSVCNLASIALQRFIKSSCEYDFKKLYDVAYLTTINLDKVIDITFYPTDATKRSNFRHRPVGLGVQGLADVFILMKMPFDSIEASVLNKQIFETIYFAAMNASLFLSKELNNKIVNFETFKGPILFNNTNDITLANNTDFNITYGEYNRSNELIRGSYSSFEGSPLSKGLFQFDLWGDKPNEYLNYDWDSLREEIKIYGVRNSLTTAIMPTASTASILRSIECIEPLKSNLYTRRVLSGEFIQINSYLQNDLKKIGLWDNKMINKLMEKRGSIQDIPGIPIEIKNIYKTAFEIKQKVIIDMARGRAPFIDQTQSMNLFVADPTAAILTSCHVYSWQQGLKTGMYYLRRQPKATSIQFTLATKKDEETCESCSA